MRLGRTLHNWLEGVRRAFARRAFAGAGLEPSDADVIQLSSLGGDAALLGAAELAGQGSREKG